MSPLIFAILAAAILSVAVIMGVCVSGAADKNAAAILGVGVIILGMGVIILGVIVIVDAADATRSLRDEP